MTSNFTSGWLAAATVRGRSVYYFDNSTHNSGFSARSIETLMLISKASFNVNTLLDVVVVHLFTQEGKHWTFEGEHWDKF